MDTFCCAVQVARSLYDVKRLTGLGIFFQEEEEEWNEKKRRIQEKHKKRESNRLSVG